jgi:thiamine-monophosphate kinase
VDVGAGALLLLATDQLIANVHYEEKSTSPADIAAKLLKRNLSDIAAMGGTPKHALLAMALAGTGKKRQWIEEFFRSLASVAERYGVEIAGGDVAADPDGNDVFSLTITGMADKDKVATRSAAEPGDALVATGTFGRSYPTGHHISFEPRLREAAFLADGFAKAMIDVSDGLLIDAGRMARASGLELEIDPDSVPRRDGASTEEALGDGEDYEILAAVPKSRLRELLDEWPFDTPLTPIGGFHPLGEAPRNPDAPHTDGGGFVHFA